MKKHARLRTRSQRPSLPHRGAIRVGCPARPLRRAPGRPRTGRSGADHGPGCDADGGHTQRRRRRGAGLGSRTARLGAADRSRLRRGRRQGRPVGGRVGGGRGDPARLRPGTEARAGRVSRRQSAAPVVPARRGVHRPGLSSGRAAGERRAVGAGAAGDRQGGRRALRAVGGRARVRYDQLRHPHRLADARRAGPARSRQEQEERPARGRSGSAGQRDGACAVAVPQLSGQRIGPVGARGVPDRVGAVARGAGQCRRPRAASAAHGGAGRRVLEPAARTRSGRRRLLQPHLVAAGAQGRGRGAADGGAAR